LAIRFRDQISDNLSGLEVPAQEHWGEQMGRPDEPDGPPEPVSHVRVPPGALLAALGSLPGNQDTRWESSRRDYRCLEVDLRHFIYVADDTTPLTRACANAASAASCTSALGGSLADTVAGRPGDRCNISAPNHDG
jgi:hypothetical protein